ncbi:MAG: 2-amino-4-hydroxy-6-hydroxymethyldihydropteridine diphosphokinase [Micropruina sp.]|nr:2-amino-4-hydroxy-6-hydroxymethyldihydropteridine diphosphokinase [Micropruina sp.]
MTNPTAPTELDIDTLSGMVPVRQVVFSMGSNLGDRAGFLQGALNALLSTPNLYPVDVSSVYETVPVGPVADQPDFLNIVVRADSSLSSLVLLERAQAIEDNFQRARETPGGPRTIDIDLIVVGSRIKTTPELTLPHPRARERAFVLVPWLEIDPAAELPGIGRVAELMTGIDVSGVRRRGDLTVEL